MEQNQYASRVRKTKYAVYEALTELLQGKPLEQVSVKELCSRAGINRSTFYNHYGSQYDVLREMGNELLADISGELSDTRANDPESVERQVAQCFRSARDHAQLFLLLLDGSVDKTFADRLFSLPQIEALLGEALAGCSEGERKMTIEFAIHGACALLVKWLGSGSPQSPEEEAALILRLARRVCRRQTQDANKTGSGAIKETEDSPFRQRNCGRYSQRGLISSDCTKNSKKTWNSNKKVRRMCKTLACLFRLCYYVYTGLETLPISIPGRFPK